MIHFDTKRLPLLKGEENTMPREYYLLLLMTILANCMQLFHLINHNTVQQVLDECPYTVECAYSDNGTEYKSTDSHAFVSLCRAASKTGHFYFALTWLCKLKESRYDSGLWWGDQSMGKKKINTTVWMTMMKRYTIIGGIGLCVFTVSLWRIYTLAGHVKPMWLSMVAGTGALMLASGMFGLAVSCFFHLWFKPSVQDSGTVLSESNRNA